MTRTSSVLFQLFFVWSPSLLVLVLALCSHWSIVDVALIFSCSAHNVADRQTRVLLTMANARLVGVKNTCGVDYQLLSVSNKTV